ncbi:Arc family DNA-binding protein [Komagataeibacter europaeus]|uniref:Arc family DNA-binding protein n=1 Tax=Komagataeibacter europaeus TaxID=33995 RepID=UPI000B3E946B|nr:Arc family DNA-binding protein [Komagataeibacter europaeus]
MSDPEKQIHVRLPESLKAKIEASAKSSGRSVNAEVVQRLENSFLSASDMMERELIEAEDELVASLERSLQHVQKSVSEAEKKAEPTSEKKRISALDRAIAHLEISMWKIEEKRLTRDIENMRIKIEKEKSKRKIK